MTPSSTEARKVARVALVCEGILVPYATVGVASALIDQVAAALDAFRDTDPVRIAASALLEKTRQSRGGLGVMVDREAIAALKAAFGGEEEDEEEEDDPAPSRCTGNLDETSGRIVHDGDPCPIHEPRQHGEDR